VFDFTLNRGRDGPKYFLKDYRQVLLADAYSGYNGVVAGNEITRAGCWAHYLESGFIWRANVSTALFASTSESALQIMPNRCL
jgi:hypothetical protein